MKRIICFFLKHKYVFGRELNNGIPTGKMFVEVLVVCKRCGDLKVEKSKWD